MLLPAIHSVNPFCEMMITIQLLTACFNPRVGSSTKVHGALFPDGATIWDFSDTCESTVNTILPLLIAEFRECDGSEAKPTVFPSICGTSTIAVPALEEIEKVAKVEYAKDNEREQAVVIITGGVIGDSISAVQTTTSKLKEAGVSTIIAAGSSQFTPIDVNVLQRYTLGIDENAIAKDNAISLGIAIVERLNASGTVCSDHG